MAFLDFFKNIFSKQIQGTALTAFRTINVGNPEVYPEINAQRAIDLGYEANSAVYSIVSKSAKKFAAIPSYVNTVNDKGSVNYKVLETLLDHPNSYQGQDAFREELYTWKLLTGEAFIFLNRGDITDANGKLLPDDTIDRMPVLEMQVLPVNFIYLVPDPSDVMGVLGYIFQQSGTRIKIRKNDVIHWKGTNLDFDAVTRQHLRGMSPLTPGYRSLTANNAAIDATVRMHTSDGAKGIIYQNTDEPWETTPEQNTQLRSVLTQKVNNNDSKGSVVPLAGKWGYLDLTSSMDLKLLQAREFAWKELCGLFDIPYELFQSDTAYANKEWAQKNWVTNTIIPACKQLDDEMNRQLLKAYNLDGLVYIECDYSGLSEMQKDLNLQATGLNTAVWLTLNEKRIAMGYEPLADPSFDQPWLPATSSPLNQITEEFNTVNQINNAQPPVA